MKLIPLLDHLAATPTTPAPRRALLAQLGGAAVAALPAVLSALPAAAGIKVTSYDAVAQLLLLERTQLALYTQALAAPGLIPVAQVVDFQAMQRHQSQHAAFLVQALQNAGAVVPALPSFDFSGRRGMATNPVLFPSVLTVYEDFLALAQQLEDLGVRLYKTQVLFISNDPQLARAALRLHTVEARHAAHIRSLRRGRGVAVSNWPSDDDAPMTRPAAAAVLTTAATGGEDSAAQSLTLGTLLPFLTIFYTRDLGVRPTSIAEAFDEPVNTATAQTALSLFS